MSTFWLQQKHILGSKHEAIKARSDVDHVWSILLPHLTSKGVKQYKEIKAAHYGEKSRTK